MSTDLLGPLPGVRAELLWTDRRGRGCVRSGPARDLMKMLATLRCEARVELGGEVIAECTRRSGEDGRRRWFWWYDEAAIAAAEKRQEEQRLRAIVEEKRTRGVCIEPPCDLNAEPQSDYCGRHLGFNTTTVEQRK